MSFATENQFYSFTYKAYCDCFVEASRELLLITPNTFEFVQRTSGKASFACQRRRRNAPYFHPQPTGCHSTHNNIKAWPSADCGFTGHGILCHQTKERSESSAAKGDSRGRWGHQLWPIQQQWWRSETFFKYKQLTINPLDARSRYTDFAQTSLRCQKSVYRRHGISTPPPESGIPAARYINPTGQKPVYQICFLMRTDTGMPES